MIASIECQTRAIIRIVLAMAARMRQPVDTDRLIAMIWTGSRW